MSDKPSKNKTTARLEVTALPVDLLNRITPRNYYAESIQMTMHDDPGALEVVVTYLKDPDHKWGFVLSHRDAAKLSRKLRKLLKPLRG